MTRGKKTCKILKEIRQQIAERNDIEYITSECHFQGECKGTCPKCEAELQYLENELSKRRQLGKAVAVAGISLGLLGTFPNCVTYYDTVIEKTVVVTSAYTQTEGIGTVVKGKVTESDGKTPIEFAVVRLMQDNELVIGAIVNERGLFTFDSVPVGIYEIRITCVGFQEYIIKEVEIKENSLTDIGVVKLKAIYQESVIVGNPR